MTEVLTPLAVAAQARQVEMVPALDPGLPTVVADRGKLAQILHHLLTNAIRFTPAGGRVTVRTRRIGTREGEEAEIAVEDTGIGIRAEDRERIFRGFEQVDTSDTRQYGGAGLGLTLVRRLVELHGGRVWAESGGEGQGARFIVRLPLLTAPLPRRVLIVEDEALLRREMAETLGAAGFAVGEAATGAEALAALAGPPPDLLILDIVLPDLDGWEVLAQVRREGRTRGLPVLIITGLESIRADQALALGADEFLAKPVSAQVLVDTVGRLLRQAAAH
ncbi:MAG: response regulator [candidate division NC10 bacterium]|nr:response regulator [candidate division NC10 bacterium]